MTRQSIYPSSLSFRERNGSTDKHNLPGNEDEGGDDEDNSLGKVRWKGSEELEKILYRGIDTVVV